jgi:probable phosphoglycerate mutase
MPEGRCPTRLVLIRHGESRAAVDRVVGGHLGCRGLAELGVLQASALAARLSATGELGKVDALVASVLPRAVETARLIAPALGWPADDIRLDCDFCELHPGECDGMRWEDFQAAYGNPDMGRNPYVPLSPRGESLAEFHLRAGRALTQLVDAHRGQTVVLACHGGVISASVVTFFGLPVVGRLVELSPINTSITEWSFPPAGRPELVRYNDAAHLAGMDFS